MLLVQSFAWVFRSSTEYTAPPLCLGAALLPFSWVTFAFLELLVPTKLKHSDDFFGDF